MTQTTISHTNSPFCRLNKRGKRRRQVAEGASLPQRYLHTRVTSEREAPLYIGIMLGLHGLIACADLSRLSRLAYLALVQYRSFADRSCRRLTAPSQVMRCLDV